jgi:hypothetical protein
MLGQAVRLDGKLKEVARQDSDLDPIRQDARFHRLIGGESSQAGPAPAP